MPTINKHQLTTQDVLNEIHNVKNSIAYHQTHTALAEAQLEVLLEVLHRIEIMSGVDGVDSVGAW